MRPIPLRPDYSSLARRPDPVARAAHVAVMSTLDGPSPGGLEALASRMYPNDRDVELLVKGAVSPAQTAGTWGGSTFATDALGPWLASLAESSAAFRLASLGISVSLDGINAMTFPRRALAGGAFLPDATVDWVGESAAIPAHAYALEAVTLGPMRKLKRIISMSREVARVGGEQAIGTMLREDVGAALDKLVFSTTAVSAGISPAGLLNSLVAKTASALTNLTEAMLADLETLGGAVCDLGSSGSNLIYVASPRQAVSANLRLRTVPGQQRVTVVPSHALADGVVVAIDPAAFVCSFGVPTISASIDTTLVMNTVAAAIGTAGSPPVVGAPTQSVWQQDLVALKVGLPATWVMRAPLIAFVTGVLWGKAP